jgi:putative tricarboxylic transport membrane protein
VRQADRIGALFLLLFAVGYGALSVHDYPYWAPTGPGSGFLPVWLALAMGVLAILLFAGAGPGQTPGSSWLPAGAGLRRLVVVVGASVALVSLLEVVGIVLGAALFLIGLLRFLEGYSWPRTLAVAAGTAVVAYALFVYWLRVPLPVGIILGIFGI